MNYKLRLVEGRAYTLKYVHIYQIIHKHVGLSYVLTWY
jgi:hypothetical protein